MVRLTDIPVVIINLRREPERKAASVKFFTEIGFTNIIPLEAVDGQQLLSSGGRLRKISNTAWRVSYDQKTSSGNSRVCHHLYCGKLGAFGATDLWAQHACSMSHKQAWNLACQLFGTIAQY